MAVERISGGSSLIDVLDRVLDKGIVIDAWVRISLVGIDLITVEARVVVASIDTYLKYADIVGLLPTVARPQLGTPAEEEVVRVRVEEEEGPRRPPRTPARRAAGRR
jgi:gas vesicle structural protein